MITEINESKTLTNHVSCECKCKFGGRKCNSNQKWNKDKCECECKEDNICEKDYIWNPATCISKNGKYLANIMGDQCEQIKNAEAQPYDEETKTIPKNFNERKATCKTQNFYILFEFLLITIILVIAVSIYCYLIKYRAKQMRLLPFHIRNKKLK